MTVVRREYNHLVFCQRKVTKIRNFLKYLVFMVIKKRSDALLSNNSFHHKIEDINKILFALFYLCLFIKIANIIEKSRVMNKNKARMLETYTKPLYSQLLMVVFKAVYQPKSNSKRKTVAIKVRAPSLAPERSGGLNVIWELIVKIR